LHYYEEGSTPALQLVINIQQDYWEI